MDRVKNIGYVKNSRLEFDLPTSVNDRVITQGFYIHETPHIHENMPLQKFPNLQ